MRKASLGEFEKFVLLATAILSGEAYGVSIAKEHKRLSGRSGSMAAVHISLHRLQDKGLVTSFMEGATTVRGGRRKRLFTITIAGNHILHEIHYTRNLKWGLLPKTTFS